MMADRKRLGALVLAQCAAFAAVVILAAFSGHGHSPSPPHVMFKVRASGTSPSSSFRTTKVVTLDAGTLEPVASGQLGSDNSANEKVRPDNSYLVCLLPPQGWKSTGGTYQLQDWICRYLTHVGADETVSFTLRPASSPGAGGT
jgi:hypothetical protein